MNIEIEEAFDKVFKLIKAQVIEEFTESEDYWKLVGNGVRSEISGLVKFYCVPSEGAAVNSSLMLYLGNTDLDVELVVNLEDVLNDDINSKLMECNLRHIESRLSFMLDSVREKIATGQ